MWAQPADRVLLVWRLICDKEERRPDPPWGALGGYERPGRKGTRLGGVQMVGRPLGTDGSWARKKNGRPPRLLYALEMSAIRKSLWAAAGRRFWHGLWYDHGASPCWKLSPGSNIWICGWG
jgi:hypothetical protein